LSHDVDWRLQGPPLEHILARKERFDDGILDNLGIKNPYYNFPEFMDLEEKANVRSTFFFRTKYENGNFADYEDDLRSLIKGGWEIGLHTDPSSINDIEKICKEKTELENLTKSKLWGNRVHYLGFNAEFPKKLQDLGFVYDSTMKNSNSQITERDMGFYKFDKLIEFPITLMDAYMFTHMKIKEEQIVSTVETTLNHARKDSLDFNIVTIIWHDNVLKMKGGRMYKKILEFLTQQEDVKICNGIQLVDTIKKLNRVPKDIR